MIGEIEGREAGRGVARQRGGGRHRIETLPVALEVRHLPEPGERARDLEPRREGQSLDRSLGRQLLEARLHIDPRRAELRRLARDRSRCRSPSRSANPTWSAGTTGSARAGRAACAPRAARRAMSAPAPATSTCSAPRPEDDHPRRDRRIPPRQREHRDAHEDEVHQHRRHEDVDAEQEIAGDMAAHHRERRHRRTHDDRDVRRPTRPDAPPRRSPGRSRPPPTRRAAARSPSASPAGP